MILRGTSCAKYNVFVCILYLSCGFLPWRHFRDWQPQRILTNWGRTKWSCGGSEKDLTAVNPLGHLRYLVARKFATSNSLQASLKSNKPQKKQWITAVNHGWLQEGQNMKRLKCRHLVAWETNEQKTGPCQNKTLPSSKVGRKDWSNGGWRVDELTLSALAI